MSAWGTVKTYAQNTEVIYYSPNIVRVVKTPTDAKVEHHSWVVTATPQAGNAKNVLVKKSEPVCFAGSSSQPLIAWLPPSPASWLTFKSTEEAPV